MSGLIDLPSSQPYNLFMSEHNPKESCRPGPNHLLSPVSADLSGKGWGVLIVAHGSPEEKGNIHFRQTFSMLKKNASRGRSEAGVHRACGPFCIGFHPGISLERGGDCDGSIPPF